MFSSKGHLLVRNLTAGTSQQSLAKISIGCVSCQANYYDALGISKKSTQGEIKAAYYRLSMVYHPDKNQGSETAAVKFREITQAYEVLGNFRLRRLYDKGIVHTAGSKHAYRTQGDTIYDTEPQPEDDPSTKFYKSRFSKSKVADSKGRTPIYNFDEWSRQHYGATLNRRRAAKSDFEHREIQRNEGTLIVQKEIMLIALGFLIFLIYYKYLLESSYDAPKGRAIKLYEEEKREEKDRTT